MAFNPLLSKVFNDKLFGWLPDNFDTFDHTFKNLYKGIKMTSLIKVYKFGGTVFQKYLNRVKYLAKFSIKNLFYF